MKKIILLITVLSCLIACNTQPKGVKVKLVNDMPNYEIVKIRIVTQCYTDQIIEENQHKSYIFRKEFNCKLVYKADTTLTFECFNTIMFGFDVYFTNNIDTIITTYRSDNSSNQTIYYGSFAYLLSFYEKQVAVNDKGMKVVGLNFKIEKGE